MRRKLFAALAVMFMAGASTTQANEVVLKSTVANTTVVAPPNLKRVHITFSRGVLDGCTEVGFDLVFGGGCLDWCFGYADIKIVSYNIKTGRLICNLVMRGKKAGTLTGKLSYSCGSYIYTGVYKEVNGSRSNFWFEGCESDNAI